MLIILKGGPRDGNIINVSDDTREFHIARHPDIDFDPTLDPIDYSRNTFLGVDVYIRSIDSDSPELGPIVFEWKSFDEERRRP
jgi:hypothetical protein